MRLNSLDRFIQDIVIQAGASIRNNFGVITTGTAKSSRHDIVTQADYIAEDILISNIRKKFPHHNILSEEAGYLAGSGEYTWIIDPLDGTRNFSQQIPLIGVIVALAKGSVIENAAIYDPLHEELYYARKGRGSYLNGKRIRVSHETGLDDMTVSISNIRHRSSVEQFAHWRSLIALYTTYYKAFGSAAQTTSAVACGRLDAYIISGAYPWDIAAGALLMREAGGKITCLDGKRWNWREPNQQVVLANPTLHKKIMKLLWT